MWYFSISLVNHTFLSNGWLY